MIKMKSKHAGSTITKKKKIMTSSHYLRGRKRQDPAFVKRRLMMLSCLGQLQLWKNVNAEIFSCFDLSIVVHQITYVVQAANLVSFSRPKWPSTYAPAAER
nr:hypothetical protein [Tanacetum cinerariifolium]